MSFLYTYITIENTKAGNNILETYRNLRNHNSIIIFLFFMSIIILALMTTSTYHRMPLADDIVDCYFCSVGCFQFRMMHSDAESSFKLI